MLRVGDSNDIFVHFLNISVPDVVVYFDEAHKREEQIHTRSGKGLKLLQAKGKFVCGLWLVFHTFS